MKTCAATLSVIFFVLAFAHQVPAKETASPSPSKVSRDIYVVVDHYRNREMVATAEFYIQAMPESVWHVLYQDFDQWSTFMPDIIFNRVISQEKAELIVASHPRSFEEVLRLAGDENLPPMERQVLQPQKSPVIFYGLSYLNLPWPVANRWTLVKETDQTDPSQSSYHRTYSLIAGDIVSAEGRWAAKPHPGDPEGSLVSYYYKADAGFEIPSFLLKPSARRATKKILEAVRARAEEKQARR